MFKLDQKPWSHLEIDEVEERRYADVFKTRFHRMYAACLWTIARQDLSFNRKMRVYGSQLRALLKLQ
jgi:hypothetical protein